MHAHRGAGGELQYKCHFLLHFLLKKAEIRENRPCKTLVFVLKMAICFATRGTKFFFHERTTGANFIQR